MMGKVMPIRREDRCANCGRAIAVGTTAVWFKSERVVRCIACYQPTSHIGESDSHTTDPLPAGDRLLADIAGGSAIAEYERRSKRDRERKEQAISDDAAMRERVKSEHPVLGRMVLPFVRRPTMTPESQATQAWKTGAEGEERVGEVLTGVVGIEVLHDRRIPGTRANIDHIVVGPAGVFVVDAKKYSGQIETRDVGGLFRTDWRLYVAGRDRSKLVEGMTRQMAVVRTALADAHRDVPVHGVLCFIGAEWGWSMRAKTISGVTALWPLKLPEHVSQPGDHGSVTAAVADHLRQALRPMRQ